MTDKNGQPRGDNYNLRHGGVLIAVQINILHEHIQLKIGYSDYLVLQMCSKKTQPLMICIVYKASNPSLNQWVSVTLKSLVEQLNAYAKENECEKVVLTSDFIFPQTTWFTMSSNNPYEYEVN